LDGHGNKRAGDDDLVNWSWVATDDLVAERRSHARELTGSKLAAVSYVLIDYGQQDRSTGSHGSRLISNQDELASPAWRYETFDCADYAVEVTTEAGRVFTASWDSPGYHTGVWLREVPARGSAYVADADVAVWDVSRAGRWDSYIGVEVTDVILHYRHCDDGYECSRITVAFDHGSVELLLADNDADHLLVPSADNIAVLFPPEPLPQWACDS
jgi:hypothetical protein